VAKIIIKTELEGLENFQDVIKDAMNRRLKGEAAKDKAKAVIKQANEDLILLFKTLNIQDKEGLETKTTGKFTWYDDSTSKSFKKDECKAFLAAKGIDIEIINEAFKSATYESPKAGYLKWDKPKKKKTKKEA
jgi:hypothetical protein